MSTQLIFVAGFETKNKKYGRLCWISCTIIVNL